MGAYISLFKPLLLCAKSRCLFCLSHFSLKGSLSGALPRIFGIVYILYHVCFLHSVLLWGFVYLIGALNMNCLVV